jgi:undecaprenyl-diphosphatase
LTPVSLISAAIIAIPLFLFGFIAQAVAEHKPLKFDRYIMTALRDRSDPSVPVGPAWLREAARDVTSLGSNIVLGIVIFAVVGYLFFDHKPAVAALMLIAVIGGVALNDLLKYVFARPRPHFVMHAARVFTTSFPSGHATLSAIAYLTMGVLLARTQHSFAISLYFISLAVFLTAIIGVSRVYLGVHYPTDIVAGWCIGGAWAMACWVLMMWLQRGGQVESPVPL